MSEHKISYVIPTLNEKGYIEKCIDSIEQQEFEKEIIVVDGGSTDGTLDVVNRRVDKIIEGVEGRGKSRDVGAKQAEGDYIAFIDADTFLKENYAEKMVSKLEDQDCEAGTSLFEITGFRSKPIEWSCNYWYLRRETPMMPGFNTFVSTECYLDSEGFEDIPGEDLQFSKKISKKTDIAVVREKLVFNSGRRVKKYGLMGTTAYYIVKDMKRRKKNLVKG